MEGLDGSDKGLPFLRGELTEFFALFYRRIWTGITSAVAVDHESHTAVHRNMPTKVFIVISRFPGDEGLGT